ncbi:hypothetical protein [Mesonia maritima]|uniref:Uncharacterized protein n=1 Tax=Mesonia maritima TaxID=1793873 RepID=A0ABU1K1F3_9FLAO|nr:hypothetical protein [Mesonia maritima]MDR6299434.1 hypothetical protein [Mesonia maritima]
MFSPKTIKDKQLRKEFLSELRESYCKNSNYPGFMAMIDTLSMFKMNNNIKKLPNSQVNLLTGSFIADVLIDGAYRLVFGCRKESFIEFTTAEGKTFQLTDEEFQQKWSGLVIDLSKSKKPGFIQKVYNDLTAIF